MNNIVQARVNEKIQQEAAIVLSEIGLTISDVCRMLLTRIAQEKVLPIEPFIPNRQTLEAIEAARKGEFIANCNLDNLLTELNAHD